MRTLKLFAALGLAVFGVGLAQAADVLSLAFSRDNTTASDDMTVTITENGTAQETATWTATDATDTTSANYTQTGNNSSPATFFAGVSGSNTNVTAGYPMVLCQFTYANDFEWSMQIPVTTTTDLSLASVLPELYVCNSSGADQSDAKILNFSVSVYASTDTSLETALITASGTTSSLSGALLNTTSATFDSTSLTAGSYTVVLTVTPNSCGGGAFTGVKGITFSGTTVDYTRTLEAGATADWSSDGTWSDGTNTATAPDYADNATVTLNGANTLTMNASASLNSLTVNGTATTDTLTFATDGSSTLTASSTTITGASVDASTGVSSLGAVSLGASGAVTLSSVDQFTSITGTDSTAAFTLNASTAQTPSSTQLTNIKALTGLSTFKGSDSVGATLNFGTSNSSGLSGRLAFIGGTH